METAWTDTWQGPGEVRFPLFHWRRWREILQASKGQKVLPTKSGLMLIILCLGLGMAAYNTASNVLFLALSLLLATFVVSGLLSWINFRGLRWRLVCQDSHRVGENAIIALVVENRKRVFPTFAIWFDCLARLSGKAFRISMTGKLAGRGRAVLDWHYTPERRGREVLQIGSAGSAYPFGFLQKHFPAGISRTITVWPARIKYHWSLPASAFLQFRGDSTRTYGQASDFLGIRPYQAGDNHRRIHWRASARSRRLMLRQMSSESIAGFILQISSNQELWREAEVFEVMCRFAVSLAEDLFMDNRLAGFAINSERSQRVHRLSDLEEFFDEMAVLQPQFCDPVSGLGQRRDVLTLLPGEGRGVHAYVRGEIAATA